MLVSASPGKFSNLWLLALTEWMKRWKKRKTKYLLEKFQAPSGHQTRNKLMFIINHSMIGLNERESVRNKSEVKKRIEPNWCFRVISQNESEQQKKRGRKLKSFARAFRFLVSMARRPRGRGQTGTFIFIWLTSIQSELMSGKMLGVTYIYRWMYAAQSYDWWNIFSINIKNQNEIKHDFKQLHDIKS